MQVFCPSFFLAVAFTGKSSSALMFYNTILFLIYLVELLVLHFLFTGGEDLWDGEGLILPDRGRSFLRICRTSGKNVSNGV